MAKETSKTETPKVTKITVDDLLAQAAKVAKLAKNRDKLQGDGLEKTVKKFREKMEAKRKAIEAELPTELEKLSKFEALFKSVSKV